MKQSLQINRRPHKQAVIKISLGLKNPTRIIRLIVQTFSTFKIIKKWNLSCSQAHLKKKRNKTPCKLSLVLIVQSSRSEFLNSKTKDRYIPNKILVFDEASLSASKVTRFSAWGTGCKTVYFVYIWTFINSI